MNKIVKKRKRLLVTTIVLLSLTSVLAIVTTIFFFNAYSIVCSDPEGFGESIGKAVAIIFSVGLFYALSLVATGVFIVITIVFASSFIAYSKKNKLEFKKGFIFLLVNIFYIILFSFLTIVLLS